MYFRNLDGEQDTYNKTFWKPIKSFLSDKIVSKEKPNLVEMDEIFESDINTAQVLLNYFFNIASNLEIEKYGYCNLVSHSINDPVTKSIVKHRNHPTILKIEECNKQHRSFLSLDLAKASQDRDIPARIIRKKCSYFFRLFF